MKLKAKFFLLLSILIILSIAIVYYLYPNKYNLEKKNAALPTNSIYTNLLQKLNYMIKSDSLYNFIKIEKKSLTVYSDIDRKRIEFKIDFCTIDSFGTNIFNYPDSLIFKNLHKQKQRKQYLQSNKNRKFRIAIDPGHIAGSFQEGLLEGKAFSIDTFKIYESLLNYSTALFLRNLLEKSNIETMITIKKHGFTAFDKTYSDWLKSDFKKSIKIKLENNELDNKQAEYLLEKATKEQIFANFFNKLDLEQRAKKINTFDPDLTIIIHYDIDFFNWQDFMATKKMKPSQNNHFIVFIPGAFSDNELATPEQRFEFTRLLIDSTIETSQKIAKYFTNEIKNNTKINLLENSSGLNWDNFAIKTAEAGIFHRNLYLTSTIRSPLVYCETLTQDNVYEYKKLATNTVQIFDVKASKRTQEIAQVYHNAIIKYMKSIRK